MWIKEFKLCVIFLAYFAIVWFIFTFVNEIQPTPLVDELFHLPQGLKYCHGNFSEWDPKITTLPGLYIVSFLYLRLAEFITSHNDFCCTYTLRLTSLICSFLSFILLFSISEFNHNVGKDIKKYYLTLWSAFNISLLPVSFFFNFFYYTDALSTFFVLLMYRLHLSKNYWIAAAVGLCSVLVRQTNIVWVGFMFLDLIVSFVNGVANQRDAFNLKYLYKVTKILCNENEKLKNTLFDVFKDALGYLLVCFLFMLFLYVNKGIVVGDRSAHQPVFHICQLFYFSLFSIFFAFPHFLEKIRSFLLFIVQYKIYFMLFLFVGMLIVKYNTWVHPYLLADNRHYTFYIWKRVYEKHALARYFLLPIYYFGAYCVNSSIPPRLQLQYWLSTALCIIPQKLIEFRYFLLPFIIFRINMHFQSTKSLLAETLFYLALNIITMNIFFTKTFYWPDSNEIQRIMW